jgi:hypothetical protein
VVLGDGSEGRSSIKQLTLEFDGIVDPSGDAFSLTQRETNSQVEIAWKIDNSSGVSIVVITFSGSLTETSGSLVDGNYELRVDGDLLGVAANDFAFGNEEADSFFRQFGDGNGDRTVNVLDLLPFRRTYGLTDADPGFDSQFDSDGNNIVNILDLLSFRRNYLTTLEWV